MFSHINIDIDMFLWIGICVDLRSVMGMDTVKMISASEALLAYDATSAAYAMINGGEPSLMSGLYLFLMSAGEGG